MKKRSKRTLFLILNPNRTCGNEILVEDINLKEEYENDMAKIENDEETAFHNVGNIFERTSGDLKHINWYETQIKQEKVEVKEEFVLNDFNEQEIKMRKKELNYKFVF